jgi:hypothetical protein
VSGYTPLFDSLTRGTLCGRWPDIGLWPIILSLADKNGEVDVTPLYIAGITGLAEQEVIACMQRFCQPDPYSRSQDAEGRRLELLDDHRNWGWHIVNHGKYREKARLAAKNARDVEAGKEAERKRNARECPPMSADVRRSPPVSDPSNANANSNSNTTLPSVGKARQRAARLPEDFDLTDERRAVAEAEKVPAERTFAKFCDHWLAASGQSSRKLDWDAAWRNWCRTEADRSRGSSRPAPKLSYSEQLAADMKAKGMM